MVMFVSWQNTATRVQSTQKALLCDRISSTKLAVKSRITYQSLGRGPAAITDFLFTIRVNLLPLVGLILIKMAPACKIALMDSGEEVVQTTLI